MKIKTFKRQINKIIHKMFKKIRFKPPKYKLKSSAPNGLKGLILDLRGNPGGLLDAAVEIASYLVPAQSDIVSAKGISSTSTYKRLISSLRLQFFLKFLPIHQQQA